MKKGWKILLIVCGVLAVGGITLCVVGVSLGATFASFRDYYPLYVHEDWDDDWRDWDDDWDDDDWHNHNASAQEGTVMTTDNSFTGITEIDLDAKATVEVLVKEHEGETIEVDFSGLNSTVTSSCRQEGTELHIDIKKHGVRTNNGGTAIVYIPKNTTYHEASFSVGAGILLLDGVKAQELDIQVGAGEGKLSNLTATKLDAECGAGELIMTAITADTTDLECGVGLLKYQAVGADKDYNYNIKCGIGEVQVGSEIFSGLGSKKSINNGSSNTMDIDCGIGEISVSFTK